MKTKIVKECANSITDGVIADLTLKGFKANRINNAAVFDPVRRVFRKKKESDLGIADILACIHGYYVAIEVKFDKDTMDDYQEKYQTDVEKAEGIYVIIRFWSEWPALYEEIMQLIRKKR